jgi:hypothetical protein
MIDEIMQENKQDSEEQKEKKQGGFFNGVLSMFKGRKNKDKDKLNESDKSNADDILGNSSHIQTF